MINSDKTSYSLPLVVYPAFNHVISYIPSLNVYLDSTAGIGTPYGVLPIVDLDKPVVHAALGAPLHRTPTLEPAQFSATRVTHLTLDDDGNAAGDFSITANGSAAIDLRDMQNSIGKRKEKEWVHELLDAKGLEGQGTVAFDDAADGSQMTLRMQVTLPNFMSIGENGTIPLSPLLAGPISFDHLRSVYQRAQRTLPYWCPAWTLEDRYEIRVPAGLDVRVPKAQSLAQAGFLYESQYKFADGMLTVVRKLSIQHEALACQSTRFAAEKIAVKQIERDLRAQIVYQVMAPGSAGAARSAQAAASSIASTAQLAQSPLSLQSANTAADTHQQAK